MKYHTGGYSKIIFVNKESTNIHIQYAPLAMPSVPGNRICYHIPRHCQNRKKTLKLSITYKTSLTEAINSVTKLNTLTKSNNTTSKRIVNHKKNIRKTNKDDQQV